MNTWWGRFLQLRRASHRRAGLLAHKKHEAVENTYFSLSLSLFTYLALSCRGDSEEGSPSQWGMHVRLSYLYAGGHSLWQNNVFSGKVLFLLCDPSLKTLTDSEAPAICISLQWVFKLNVFTQFDWIWCKFLANAWRRSSGCQELQISKKDPSYGCKTHNPCSLALTESVIQFLYESQ